MCVARSKIIRTRRTVSAERKRRMGRIQRRGMRFCWPLALQHSRIHKEKLVSRIRRWTDQGWQEVCQSSRITAFEYINRQPDWLFSMVVSTIVSPRQCQNWEKTGMLYAYWKRYSSRACRITYTGSQNLPPLPSRLERPTPSRLMLIKLIKEERIKVFVISAKISLENHPC